MFKMYLGLYFYTGMAGPKVPKRITPKREFVTPSPQEEGCAPPRRATQGSTRSGGRKYEKEQGARPLSWFSQEGEGNTG